MHSAPSTHSMARSLVHSCWRESDAPHLRKRSCIKHHAVFDWAGGVEAHQGAFYSREEGIMGWVEVCGLVEGANGSGETGNHGARLLA